MRISYLVFAAGPALLVFFLLISYTPANPKAAAGATASSTTISSTTLKTGAHGQMCSLREKVRERSCAAPASAVGEIPRIASR